jgi:hypothetical protein
MVPARVNGSQPLSLLLDSGYTIPTLHPAVMDTFGLEPSGSVRINGIAGEERAPTYRGLVFDFGGATYSPFRVAAVPSERDQRRRRDGIIGSGFFRRFVVEFDPKQKTIRLYPPANFAYTGAGEVLPFRFKDEVPVVRASIVLGDRPALEDEFEVDTGCDSGLCLGSSFVERNKLLAPAQAEASQKFGIGGSVETTSGTLSMLRLGSIEVHEPQTDFFLKGSPVEDPLAGHIGMGVLHRFKVIFDYSRKQMIIEK